MENPFARCGATASVAATFVSSARNSADRAEQFGGLIGQRFGLIFVDLLTLEFGSFEHADRRLRCDGWLAR